MLLLITLPKSLMLLNSLLKTQHFPVPLSVTVSKAKKVLVVLFTNDDQTWEMKGEKQLQKIVEKLTDLKLEKTYTNGNFQTPIHRFFEWLF